MLYNLLMEIHIGISKVNQHGVLVSGDTLEIIERPAGGLSVVLATGQKSGTNSKAVSSDVAHHITYRLSQGLKDSQVMQEVSNILFSKSNGRQIAFAGILSIDLESQSILLSSNNPIPVYTVHSGITKCLKGEAVPLGSTINVQPAISQLPLEHGFTIVLLSEGFSRAGIHVHDQIDICTLIDSMLDDQNPSAQDIADTIILEALRLDEGQPQNDYSAVVVSVKTKQISLIRKMTVLLPIDPVNDQFGL